MPPKKKGGGKKKGGKAARAKKERARLEELLRQADTLQKEEEVYQRKAKRTLEAQQKELRERLEAEETEENTRFNSEHEKEQAWITVYDEELVHMLDSQVAANEWAEYIKCSNDIDPNSEKEINTFLSLNANVKEVLPEKVVEDVQSMLDVARLLQKDGQADHSATMQLICERIETKFDASVDYIMRHSDQYANAKSECQLDFSKPDVQLSVWVNLTKNIRVKNVEFPASQLTIGIPKSLALANIALKASWSSVDFVTSPDTRSNYASLSGVLSLDILQLPPQPMQIKGWTMRLVAFPGGEDAVTRLTYPLGSSIGPARAVTPGSPVKQMDLNPSGMNTQVPPIKVSMAIPKTTLMRMSEPRVGWWNQQEKEWDTNPIADVRFDFTTNRLHFNTTRVGKFCLLQPCGFDIPYDLWSLVPTSPSTVAFSVGIRDRYVVIVISPKGFVLQRPDDAEIEDVRSPRVWPTALALLKELEGRGLFLLPANTDAPAEMRIIDQEIEDEAYRFAAMLSPGYVMRRSKWNNGNTYEHKAASLKIESTPAGEASDTGDESDTKGKKGKGKDKGPNLEKKVLDEFGECALSKMAAVVSELPEETQGKLDDLIKGRQALVSLEKQIEAEKEDAELSEAFEAHEGIILEVAESLKYEEADALAQSEDPEKFETAAIQRRRAKYLTVGEKDTEFRYLLKPETQAHLNLWYLVRDKASDQTKDKITNNRQYMMLQDKVRELLELVRPFAFS